MTKRILCGAVALLMGACGGAEMPGDGGQDQSPGMTQSADDLVSCRSIQWWTGYWITSNRKESYGWWDTDLAVRAAATPPDRTSACRRCRASAPTSRRRAMRAADELQTQSTQSTPSLYL